MNSLSRRELFSYGLFGLPLALLALPIYVYLPQFYANQFGLSLSLIGSLLLVARLFDACIDPLIGVWIDRQHTAHRYARMIVLSTPLLIFGYLALFHPPQLSRIPLLGWLLGSLIVMYFGYSLASISYQSWGATLTQARGERTSLTAVREACGLIGVILAAALPSLTGLASLTVVFIVSLCATGYLLLYHAPRPAITTIQSTWRDMAKPLLNPRFRWLFAVFMLNGIAAAIPATLFLFFTSDRLQLPQYAGLFLTLYFLAAACAMPLWVALSKRHGEQHAWLMAMALAIASFLWAYFLAAGDVVGYALICLLSGAALGADLALPPALLAAVIGHAGHRGKHEGSYFGLWNWATKLNLALAAGITLPLLEWLGYRSGSQEGIGLQALSAAYALLPCALKLASMLILWRAPLSKL